MPLGPSTLIAKQTIKARWGERYTSDALNKKFIGMPRGVYYGFVPVISGLELLLKPDISVSFSDPAGAAIIGETITGSTSSATAAVRVISPNFLLVDTVSGIFQVDETITGASSGFTGKVIDFLQEGLSYARVTSNTPGVAGRVDNMIAVTTTDIGSLDFTGFTDGIYYIYISGSFSITNTSFCSVAARTAPPPNQITEVLVCNVTKIGTTLTVQANSGSNPATRQEPFASAGQRIGLMPSGSIENLLAATITTQEVIASRQGVDGIIAPAFALATPQSTGLPKRLKDDLSRQLMASRLGKQLVVARGNDIPITSPITAPINISGSLSARVRDHQPFRDVTNEDPIPGIATPFILNPDASDNINLVITITGGAFAVGDALVGSTSGATAIIRAVTGTILTLNEFSGVFQTTETVAAAPPGTGTGTIVNIDNREGVITAEAGGGAGDTVRNIVSVIDTFTGKKPVDVNGNLIYGRLLFGPSGVSGPGGGDPGELLVAAGAGEQLNFVQGSTVITNNNIDFTNFFLAGDIIEGADDRWYEVDSLTATALILTAGKPYLGLNASAGSGPGAGPRRRRRYLMQFVVLSGGVESNQTLTPGTNIPSGAGIRPFLPCWLSISQSNYQADLDMGSPGDAYTIATTTVPGLGFNAPGLGGGAGAGSPLIGAFRTIQSSGTAIGDGNFHTINLSGGTVTPGAAGVINITAAGPPGPPGTAGPAAPGVIGPTGPGLTKIYDYEVKEKPINSFGITMGSDSFVFSSNPSDPPLAFYTISTALKLPAFKELDTGYITGVSFVPGTRSIQFDYKLDGGAGSANQILILGAAAVG